MISSVTVTAPGVNFLKFHTSSEIRGWMFAKKNYHQQVYCRQSAKILQYPEICFGWSQQVQMYYN